MREYFYLYGKELIENSDYRYVEGEKHDYIVTDKGEIFSISVRGISAYIRKLKGSITRGYRWHNLHIKGYPKKQLYAHRIVAALFIPNPENKPEVNHKNKDRLDNRVENLEWVTKSENERHKHLTYKVSAETRKKMSESRTGAQNTSSKKVMCIETGKTWDTAQAAAKSLKLSRNAIANAAREGYTAKNLHWKYVYPKVLSKPARLSSSKT